MYLCISSFEITYEERWRDQALRNLGNLFDDDLIEKGANSDSSIDEKDKLCEFPHFSSQQYYIDESYTGNTPRTNSST